MLPTATTATDQAAISQYVHLAVIPIPILHRICRLLLPLTPCHCSIKAD